jgi:hypothetical protein
MTTKPNSVLHPLCSVALCKAGDRDRYAAKPMRHKLDYRTRQGCSADKSLVALISSTLNLNPYSDKAE